MAEISISDDDFLRFREFFYRKTGIQFEESKRYFVDKRLVERIEKTGCDTFRHYFAMLRGEGTGVELQALVNLMTINETYFFREDYQFDCLINSILPETVATKTDGVRSISGYCPLHPAKKPIQSPCVCW